MKRTLFAGAFLALAAITSACSSKIFEDVGSDPHPPTVALVAIFPYVEPVTEPAPTTPPAAIADRTAAPRREKTIFVDTGGASLPRGKKFQIGITYADAGGDIERLALRDRDGALRIDCAPKDQNYFPGTSGSAICVESGYEITGIAGPHRIEIWVEDSHDSRSEKTEFVINLVL